MNWKLIESRLVKKTNIFSLEELQFLDKQTQKELSHAFYRINSADWVNILPITHEGEAVLIRQPRAGIIDMTLEIPGGIVDKNEDYSKAAMRELEEETGYSQGNIKHLGSISPNPALQNNMLHMFVAKNVRINTSRKHFPDANESIEVVTVPMETLETMVRNCEINSALASLTIMLALNAPK